LINFGIKIKAGKYYFVRKGRNYYFNGMMTKEYFIREGRKIIILIENGCK